jgi:hypothetical protein
MDTPCVIISVVLTVGPMLLLYLVAVRKGRTESAKENPYKSPNDRPKQTVTANPLDLAQRLAMTTPTRLVHPSLWVMFGAMALAVVTYVPMYAAAFSSNPMSHKGFLWETLLPFTFMGSVLVAIIAFVAFVIHLIASRF